MKSGQNNILVIMGWIRMAYVILMCLDDVKVPTGHTQRLFQSLSNN